jgi:hypothetical protein
VRNATLEISLMIENMVNINEKDTNNMLPTLSNSKMPNQKPSSTMTNMFYSKKIKRKNNE